uniref:Uncharacterized protein n=1 Tax=Setaria digitata TaxID=48799 RepID=A0A915Q6V9_9BILA
MGPKPKITHVIFDLDGILIDSERINFQIYQQFQMEEQLSVKEYCNQCNTLADELLSKCPLCPGVMRLVQHLAKHKIEMAVCTSSGKPEFDTKMAIHTELLSLIPLIVLAGDDPEIKRGKPAPDPFLATMKRFREKPDSAANVLVFEDSANGVRAAVAAGMQVIMVPDMSYMKPPEEVMDKIAYILKTLEEFKPESMGLPPYIS